MEWFIAVVVIAALGAAALAAAGGMGQMSKDPVRDVYRQDLPPSDQPMRAADISALRFGVTLRGYAMSQVDDVLDRLADEIAQRDARIAELSGDPVSAEAPSQGPPHEVAPGEAAHTELVHSEGQNTDGPVGDPVKPGDDAVRAADADGDHRFGSRAEHR